MAPWRSAPEKPEDSGVAGTREQTEAALRIQDDASSSGPNEISVSLEGVDIAPADEALAAGSSDAADSAAPASASAGAPASAGGSDGPGSSAGHACAGGADSEPRREGDQAPERGSITPPPVPFIVRNLDTGEFVEHQLAADEGSSRVPFDTLPGNEAAAELLRVACRGKLEKLASTSTVSFRSYQLCVWQERWVYAEDDALCYAHLTADMKPEGQSKRIPFASIEFVGPFDETQFVIKCAKRTFTFLADSAEARTRWIKSIAALAGCSCSTEVCAKTLALAADS